MCLTFVVYKMLPWKCATRVVYLALTRHIQTNSLEMYSECVVVFVVSGNGNAGDKWAVDESNPGSKRG